MSIAATQRIFLAVLFGMAPCAVTCASGSEPGASTPLTLDDFGRYNIAVMLNGKGPFRFTVDTASSSSVLSRTTAERLNLQPKGSMHTTGAYGSASTEFTAVDDYRAGVFDRHDERMTIAPNVSGDGIMGMNAFAASRIEFDYANNELRVGPSRPAPAGYAVAHGVLRFNSLMIVDVVVDGVKAKALVDTAAPFNFGNSRLQAALGYASGDPRLNSGETLADSLDKGNEPVEKATLDRLAVGDIVFAKPEMRFADMAIFRTLGLGDEPAMIIGVEQFAHMQAVAIDFPRAELQLLH